MFQQIKKAHFKYAKCQGGGLHDGQILNLVCVDDRCLHRGLICPICKMQTHDDHFILPIKSFLSQIKDIIAQPQSADESANLGAYIRTIQSTKRELLNLVREQINQLVGLFKQVQMRIEENYLSIRRNVFIQSSSSTKLPKLVELLANTDSKDPLELQNEFRKYCEMIKYKDGKPKITDKASKIVNSYKAEPITFRTSGRNAINQYKKKVLDILKILESGQSDEEIQEKGNPFLFSAEDKHSEIQLNQEKTEAWMNQNSTEGIVVLTRSFSSIQNEITFSVLKNQSYMIMVGLAYVSKIKNSSFSNSEDGSSMQVFIVSDGNTNLSYQGEASNCFEFCEGHKISVKIEAASKQCKFTKIGSSQTYSLPLKSSVFDNEDIRLCFGLSGGDRIKLQN